MMFELWKKLHHAPHHLPMEKSVWENSMYTDVDSDGRQLFAKLNTEASENAMVQMQMTLF